MNVCRRLLRLKQSKGHGVHSPFAFDLITNVLCSPYKYYAFEDIDKHIWRNEALFKKKGLDPDVITRFNYTTFRLINHFKPENVLEINPGTGVNSLFIVSSAPKASVILAEDNNEIIEDVVFLLDSYINTCNKSQQKLEIPFDQYKFTPIKELKNNKIYDAVFVNPGFFIPTAEELLELSSQKTFWVINGIKRGECKQLWRDIVNHRKTGVIFDMNDTGVVFLHHTFYKSHYFI